MLRKYLTILSGLLLASTLGAQSVGSAKSQGVGAKVSVKGIINCDAEFGAPLRYIQDASTGLAVYSDSVKNFALGDSVILTGTLKDYNNLLELDPVSGTQLISKGNTPPDPIKLDLTTAFDEKYEGMLINIGKVKFVKTGNFASGNYNVVNGTSTKEIRVNAGTNLIGSPIPTDSVELVGVLSQFKLIYQLLLRGKKDISYGNAPGIETSLIQSNITQTGFDLSFSTSLKGDTKFLYGKTKSFELGQISDTTQSLTHSGTFSGLEPATFYYVMAVSKSRSGDSSASHIGLYSTKSKSKGTIKPYFNLKVDTTVSIVSKATQLFYTIDDSLVAWINKAKYTLDLAIYSFDNKNFSANVSTAINNAFKRGVKVRIVSDAANKNQGVLDLDKSIVVKRNPTTMAYGIMHNKVLIIDANNTDSAVVVAGSTNFTDNQIYTDPNNIIYFQDEAIAKAYTLEFEEMFGGKFGPDKTDNTPHKFNLNGTEVELFFSPSDGVASQAIKAINSADNDINFCFNLITRTDIAAAIATKGYTKKVFVGGVIGDTASTGATFKTIEKSSPGNVKKDSKTGIFHHKYFIVDQFIGKDPLVFTGSYNFSTAAETKNDENVLIIHSQDIANQYFQEWKSRYKENGGLVFTALSNDLEDVISSSTIKGISFYSSEIVLSLNNIQESGKTNFRIFDLKGTELANFNRNLISGKNTISESINIPTSGLFIISSTSPSGKMMFTKIFKN